MKNLFILVLSFFCISITFGQVSSVSYVVEKNVSDNLYDAKLIINEGSAITFPQLIQFNSSYTILVPTGTVFEIVENHNPLINNEDGMSTDPAEWLLTQTVVAPTENPEYDYYSYSPQLTPTASYSNLTEGDVITLFSIEVLGLTCDLDVRPVDNQLDPTNIGGLDMSNGFTVGSAEQVYVGNVAPSNFDTQLELSLADHIICPGECVTMAPESICTVSGSTFSWSNGETIESFVICPSVSTTYSLTVTEPSGLTITASSMVTVAETPAITISTEELCVGESTSATSDIDGEWISENMAIAIIDQQGSITAISEGWAVFSFTTMDGCIAGFEILVLNAPEIQLTGPDEICVGSTTTLSPSAGGTWSSSNDDVGTVTNAGVVIGLNPGAVEFQFTDATTGCSSTSSAIVFIEPTPIVEITGPSTICFGGTTTLISTLNTGSWSSSDITVATVNPFTGEVLGVGQGTTTINFTTFNNCTSDPLTITVTETQAVDAGTYPTLYLDSGPITLVGTPAGGEFSGVGVAGHQFDPASASIGAHQITYSFTNAEGCEGSDVTTIVVEDLATSALQCADVTTICNLSDLDGFTDVMPSEDSPGTQPVSLCPDGGAPHNIIWLGFVAGGGDYEINLSYINCQGATTGIEGVQVGIYTNCDFTDAVYCDPNCSLEPVSISSAVLEEGQEYFLFIDGCSGSYCEFTIELTGNYTDSGCDDDPCDETFEWTKYPAGTFGSNYNIATFATAENLLSDDLDHLVFYNYDDGEIWMKVNNANGVLDEEIFLTQNSNNYANGEYHLELEDIDQDGLTDIILTELNLATEPDKLSIYQNMGNATFELMVEQQICGMAGPQSNLQFSDFDQDGRLDIYYVCADALTGAIFTNPDWTTEVYDTGVQSFCKIGKADVDQDGDQDIIHNGGAIAINNGDRTFTVTTHEINLECGEEYVFHEGDRSLIGQKNTFTLSAGPEYTTTYCLDPYLGEFGLPLFYSHISSPTEKQLVIPSNQGFSAFDGDAPCQDVFASFGPTIDNAVVSARTQVDLTLNGCKDFIVIEGQQINAWINPKAASKLEGLAFIDNNENGIFDEGEEEPLRNVLVTLIPGDMSILTDMDGKYKFVVEPGTYDLTATVNEGEWQMTQLMTTGILIEEPCAEGYNFGFVPIEMATPSATISITNSIARCDFETRFYITVENTGTDPIDGLLQFSFDEETSFVSTLIENYSVAGQIMTGEIRELQPFDPQTYRVTLQMPQGSSVLPLLAFNAALVTGGDILTSYNYSDQLRCSYDPNDKRVHPDREGDKNLTLFEEDLEYTIRFQNNGNDTAFTVKIVDPLDPNIDPESIRMVSSSHPVETCVDDDVLIFLFKDIMLVDSMTNYPGSQGYVTFKCNTKDGTAIESLVTNQADIIFDTNEPIVTNQTTNTMVEELCVNKMTTQDINICAGDSFMGYEAEGTYVDTFGLAFGCDSTVVINLTVTDPTIGNFEMTVCEGEVFTINGSSGSSGETYVITESTTISDTILGPNGCAIQIFNVEVELIETIMSSMDTTICQGFDYMGFSESGTYEIESIDDETDCLSVLTLDLTVLDASDPLCTTATHNLDPSTLQVFPNPVRSQLRIETAYKWETIHILDTQGRLIHQVTNTQNQLDVRGYSPGLYFIKCTDRDGASVIKKFVVE